MANDRRCPTRGAAAWRTLGLACGLASLLLVGAACSNLDDNTRTAIENVATLQSGTVSELMAERNSGPFLRYPVPPERMVGVVADAVGRARDGAGRPITMIRASEHSRYVIAKERARDASNSGGYGEPWVTAVVVFVHRDPGDAEASLIEIHWTQRGPFHKGVIDWSQQLPGLVEAAVRDHTTIRPIR